MNPSAASYTPSFAFKRKPRHEIPITAKSAGPQPITRGSSGSTGAVEAPLSPMVLPRDTANTAASMPTPVLAPASTRTGTLTAAERLRLLHPRRTETDRPTPVASSNVTPAMRGAVGASTAVTPLLAPSASLPPSSMPQTPPPQLSRGLIRYTRQQLLALEAPAIDAIRRGPIADAPPFTRLPASFVPLLNLPFALEFVNIDAASELMEGRFYSSPFIVTSSDTLPVSTTAVSSTAADITGNSGVAASGLHSSLSPDAVAERLHYYHCIECSQGGPRPCEALSTVLYNAKKFIMTQALGRCFLQSPEVVWGQIQLALVFEAKQSSLKLRMLAEKSPAIPRKVGEYLFGEGYHLLLPKVTAHEEWRSAMQMLKFDAIRDNRTRVITDLSKYWKKRHTQFEQFVAFFGYRDDIPTTEVKNILTRSVKPGMVAMLTGDVVAVILLHHLGFFIPPDYYWSVFPFLAPALGEGTMTHDVIRHLGCYFSAKQDPAMYNPVANPFATYAS